MFIALHHPPDVIIKFPNLKPRAFVDLVKTEKKGIIKIPADIGATPAVVGGIRIEPREKHGSNPEMTPLNVNAEVHSSVNSGRRKQFSTLLTNLRD